MEKKLKLYIWVDVFKTGIDGSAFAYAENPQRAKELILEVLKGVDSFIDSRARELEVQPREVTEEEGFCVFY